MLHRRHHSSVYLASPTTTLINPRIVLFNGLGSHITMIPKDKLEVFFQVRIQPSCKGYAYQLNL